MFLDIEGMFDETTFKSVKLALLEHSVDLTLSRWVTETLRNREVLINVGVPSPVPFCYWEKYNNENNVVH